MERVTVAVKAAVTVAATVTVAQAGAAVAVGAAIAQRQSRAPVTLALSRRAGHRPMLGPAAKARVLVKVRERVRRVAAGPATAGAPLLKPCMAVVVISGPETNTTAIQR